MNESAPENWRVRMSQFFKRLIHKYRYGSLPFSGGEQPLTSRCPFSFPFNCHPGPVDQAISDAVNIHAHVLIYVYCRENTQTYEMNQVLSLPSVASTISKDFIFCVADVCEPEGWKMAHRSKFHTLPLLVMLQTRGQHTSVFVKMEGLVGETALLSYMTMIRGTGASAIIQQQDEEFNLALAEAEANNLRIAEIEALAEQTRVKEEDRRRQVERDFMNITRARDKSEAVTIRFMFPHIGAQTRVFRDSAPITEVFAFARKFVFPKDFLLKTGFPMKDIVEGDDPIGTISNDRQFVVHVEVADSDT